MRRAVIAARLRELKNRNRQKDLNDRQGSWADDPGFATAVLDFGDV